MAVGVVVIEIVDDEAFDLARFQVINGVEISRASNDDVYDLVIDIAASQPTVDAIAERLRHLAT